MQLNPVVGCPEDTVARFRGADDRNLDERAGLRISRMLALD
jgi:hypothetical protein